MKDQTSQKLLFQGLAYPVEEGLGSQLLDRMGRNVNGDSFHHTFLKGLRAQIRHVGNA